MRTGTPSSPAPHRTDQQARDASGQGGNAPASHTGRVVALIVTVALAATLLALASCASFLSSCSLNPLVSINSATAGQRAQRYWQEKYGETRAVSDTIYPRYPTSIPWPNVDTDTVVVNLGEKGSYSDLVLIDLKGGHISDNRQSA